MVPARDKAEGGTSKQPDKAPVTKERKGGWSPTQETLRIIKGGVQSFRPRNTFSTPQHFTPQQHIPPGAGMNGTTTSGTHLRSVGNANENGMKVKSNR